MLDNLGRYGSIGEDLLLRDVPIEEVPTEVPPGQMSTRELGIYGERIAAIYLEKRGYELLERNYRCPEGEADLVAFDPVLAEVVLVEVKTRRGRRGAIDDFPEEAVTPAKMRRYRRITACYVMDNYPTSRSRFDVVAITVRGPQSCDIDHRYDLFCWEAER